MRARMDRIEAAGKVVSRRALRTQVRRERQAGVAEPAPQAASAADVPKQDRAPAALASVDTAAATLHVCTVEELREKVEEDSIDAVAVALHGVEEHLINAVVGFGEFAVRPGGLVLVQCPGWAVADVASIGDGPDDEDNQWMDYESLLACVGSGAGWFPVLVFRRRVRLDGPRLLLGAWTFACCSVQGVRIVVPPGASYCSVRAVSARIGRWQAGSG